MALAQTRSKGRGVAIGDTWGTEESQLGGGGGGRSSRRAKWEAGTARGEEAEGEGEGVEAGTAMFSFLHDFLPRPPDDPITCLGSLLTPKVLKNYDTSGTQPSFRGY